MWTFGSPITASKWSVYSSGDIQYHDLNSSDNNVWYIPMENVIQEHPDMICMTFDAFGDYSHGYSFNLYDTRGYEKYRVSYYKYVFSGEEFDPIELRSDIGDQTQVMKKEDPPKTSHVHDVWIHLTSLDGNILFKVVWSYAVDDKGIMYLINVRT